MGGEILSLHVGQAGVQIGSAVWELLCLEHAVIPNGMPVADDPGRHVMFSEAQDNHSVPRAVFCDLEAGCIDEIRSGPYRHLFGLDYLITGKEDASSNYARGYYTVGNEYSELCMERLRRQAEKCGTVQGIVIFRAFGGGTGSGLTANVANKVHRDFKKIQILEFSVYPAPKISPVIVEPYNAVLTTHAMMENSSCTYLFDNEAVYDICEKNLRVKNPSYTNLNRVIAQIVSGVTCSVRSPNSTGCDLGEAITNLVPFPRLHFPLVSFAPLVTNPGLQLESVRIPELLSEAFRPGSQMVKVDPREGKYLSSVLFFRGDVSPAEIDHAVDKLKNSGDVKFVNYSPTGFKVGGCSNPMRWVPGFDLGAAPASLLAVSCSTAVGAAWQRLNTKFDLMFKRRAFVHHYVGEGMNEAEFTEAREDLQSLREAFASAEAEDTPDS